MKIERHKNGEVTITFKTTLEYFEFQRALDSGRRMVEKHLLIDFLLKPFEKFSNAAKRAGLSFD